MGTILVASILDEASILLLDEEHVRWSRTELLGWFNGGQREIALQAPPVAAKTAIIPLVAGTRQTLPTDGVTLLTITRCMGLAGGPATPGLAIRLIDREILDLHQPDWHMATPDAVVANYVVDERDPKSFYVTPPQPEAGQGQVEIVYSSPPADATLDGAIVLDDVYANALLDYVLYRAFLKDYDAQANATRAQLHYAAFMSALGKQVQVIQQTGPDYQANVGPFVTVKRSSST